MWQYYPLVDFNWRLWMWCVHNTALCGTHIKVGIILWVKFIWVWRLCQSTERGVTVFLLELPVEVFVQCLGFEGGRAWLRGWGSPGDETWEERWENSLGRRRSSARRRAHLLTHFYHLWKWGAGRLKSGNWIEWKYNVNLNTFVKLRVSDCWSEGWFDLLPRSSGAALKLKLPSAQVTLSSDSFFIPGSISPSVPPLKTCFLSGFGVVSFSGDFHF